MQTFYIIPLINGSKQEIRKRMQNHFEKCSLTKIKSICIIGFALHM